jgi:hypothetical protein
MRSTPPWGTLLIRRRTRVDRTGGRSVALVLLALLTTGCAPLLSPEYYMLPSLAELYLYDDFQWSSVDEEITGEEMSWILGTTTGSAGSVVHGGSFISLTEGNFLLSNRPLWGPVTVAVTYHVLRGALEPDQNGYLFDYQIVLASGESTDTVLFGPAVELAFRAGLVTDELRIREDATSANTAALSSKPYSDPLSKNGLLEMDVDPVTGSISARFYSGDGTPVLEASATVNPIAEPFFLAVQASGDDTFLTQARAVTKVSVVKLEVE